MIAQILSVRSMSINDSDVQKRDCERKRLRGKVIKRETAAGGGGEGGGAGLVGVSGSPLTPTWPSLFSVKVTSTSPRISAAGLPKAPLWIPLPHWHADPHIDQIMCPHQTGNKIQDVSSCCGDTGSKPSQEHAVNCTRTRCRHRLLQTNSWFVFWFAKLGFPCSSWISVNIYNSELHVVLHVEFFSALVSWVYGGSEDVSSWVCRRFVLTLKGCFTNLMLPFLKSGDWRRVKYKEEWLKLRQRLRHPDLLDPSFFPDW